MLLVTLICFLLHLTDAVVTPTCSFKQQLEIGKTYFIYNDGYSNYFNAGYQCEWIATSPANTKIQLTCSDVTFNIRDCVNNVFIVDIGSKQNVFCGKTTVSQISDSNYLGVYIYSLNTQGRYSCEISAVSSGPPVTPPPTCDCGYKKQVKILGGKETGVNEYPFMAGLIDYRESGVWCGATIISQYHALTAAHCIRAVPANTYSLLVGDHDTIASSETSIKPNLLILEWYRVHPNYNANTFEYDIALLKTAQIIPFNANVGPVCLPFNQGSWLTDGTLVKLLGWGLTEFGGSKSRVLREVDVNTYNLVDCRNRYQVNSSVISQRNLCTYNKGKDACQYDSGGPVLLYDWIINRFFIVGIISYGKACGLDFPAVNTRVDQYLSWIQQNTGATFCKK